MKTDTNAEALRSTRKTLGLDLGSNSLGWAIADSESGAILDTGVVIFDEGINRVKGQDTLETPASVRRIARQGRRLKFRRRLRKFALLRALIANGMCPLSPQGLDHWRQHGAYPLEEKAFLDWLKATPEDNPYADRARAATEKVDPMTLGRALYHLVQRRGFRSSRKEAMESDGKDKETGLVKSAIKELSDQIGENRTLGQYFHECVQRGEKVRCRYTGRKEHYEKEFARIMEVQGLPEELVEELHANLFFQRPLRSQKRFVGKCPLEPDKSRCMLMRPEFEEFRMLSLVNNLRIGPRDDGRPLTREERDKVIARFFVEAPYIKIDTLAKALATKSGKTKILPELNYSTYKSISSCPVSQQLNNLFGTKLFGYKEWFHEGTTAKGKPVRYDYTTVLDALTFFQDDDKLRVFGKEKLGFSDEQADKLVKIRFAEGYAKFSLAAINKILPFLRTGSNLHQAILLAKVPELIGEERFSEDRETILHDIEDIYENNRRDRAARRIKGTTGKVFSLEDLIGNYFYTNYDLDREAFHDNAYADLTKSDYAPPKDGKTLPPVNLGMIRNPLVQRSMTILRRLVNELRSKGKIDANTHINIELARNVNDRNTRCAYELWQAGREKDRQSYREKIEEAGQTPTDDLVLRYQLATEQNWMCLYTGREISLVDIISETQDFDVEHTIPRSRSGDDSQANKTLCDNVYNRQVKKGRLPTECPNYDGPGGGYDAIIETSLRPWREKVASLEKELYQQSAKAKAIPASNPDAKSKARQKALVTKFELEYWKKKLGYFLMTADDIGEGFMNRQLVDTGIMSRHAVDFLSSVYRGPDGQRHVWAVNGSATAFARKEWGVQDTDTPKNRSNHIHHAMDAMVIAELTRQRFTDICTHLKDDHSPRIEGLSRKIVEPPFEDFGQKVHDLASAILVRHISYHKETKQVHRGNWPLAKPARTKDGIRSHVPTGGDAVRGQLHKESFYGKIRDPRTEEEIFVLRKRLGDFKDAKEIDQIVDPAVREAIREQFDSFKGASGEKDDKIFSNNTFYLKQPEEDGSGGVRVIKVRVRVKKADAHVLKRQIFPSAKSYKNAYYVDSGDGSNYQLGVYEKGLAIDNLLDWAQLHKDNPQKLEHQELGHRLGFLRKNDLVLFYDKSPEELLRCDTTSLTSQRLLGNRLYRLVKFEGEAHSFRITLMLQTEAIGITDLQNQLAAAGKSKKGASKIDFSQAPERLLRIGASYFLSHALLEGIDFRLSLDGEITFLK